MSGGNNINPYMEISIIVAAAQNDVIGKDNRLLWRLSNDMKHFKALTMGKTVIMGRKTFESIGKPLPGRRNIVVTRNNDFRAEGVEVAHTPREALEAAGTDGEIFIIGGGHLYNHFWNKAGLLYLTRVHAVIEGDTLIPEVSPGEWTETNREYHEADEKNEYGHTFITYRRK